jgi:uncharacterized protein
MDSTGPMAPLLITASVQRALLAARSAGECTLRCSLDLMRSETTVRLDAGGWWRNERQFPYPQGLRERSISYWNGESFEPMARFTTSLVKLIATDWGPPTFEIDGIKMLPTAHVCPYADARHKVALVEPAGRQILDTCGGLGYFAGCALSAGAAQVLSFELNPDVLWLRSLNPWSPDSRWSHPITPALRVMNADVRLQMSGLPDESFDAILHDPPRFGIAGELYSQSFYGQLARVLRRRGRLFHYTGTPNKLSRGRDLPREVAERLKRAGFAVEFTADGVLARKSAR